jgi:hypothetical protein
LRAEEFEKGLGVNERLAARNAHHRGAALVDGMPTLFRGQALVQHMIGVLNLPAAGTREVAPKQRFQHQGKRIAFLSRQMLADDVGAHAGDLQ